MAVLFHHRRQYLPAPLDPSSPEITRLTLVGTPSLYGFALPGLDIVTEVDQLVALELAQHLPRVPNVLEIFQHARQGRVVFQVAQGQSDAGTNARAENGGRDTGSDPATRALSW